MAPHYQQRFYLRPSFIPLFNFSHKRLIDVFPYGRHLEKSRLNLLWAPGSDTAGTTALGLCYQIVVFTTGRCTPYGGFIPTFKVATNSNLYNRKIAWNDFDASQLLTGTSVEDTCDNLLTQLIDVANGRLTAADQNRSKEFVIWKNGVSK